MQHKPPTSQGLTLVTCPLTRAQIGEASPTGKLQHADTYCNQHSDKHVGYVEIDTQHWANSGLLVGNVHLDMACMCLIVYS